MFVDVPTGLVKPSQTCHMGGVQRNKTLAERTHRCGCGASITRDENAARVMLNWELFCNAAGHKSDRGVESLLFSDVEQRNSTYTALAA